MKIDSEELLHELIKFKTESSTLIIKWVNEKKLKFELDSKKRHLFDKEVVFFDIETTGLDKFRNRIIQIGLTVIDCNGTTIETKEYSINPDDGIGTYEVSDEAMKVNGVSLESLKNKKTLIGIADELIETFKGRDLGGCNILNFDIPFLTEQFNRIGKTINLYDCNVIDIYRIVTKAEPRKLSDLVKRFCDRELDDAHSALNDTMATYKVFNKMVLQFGLSDFTNKQLHEYAFGADDNLYLDNDKKLKAVLNGNKELVDATLTFGKHKDKSLFHLIKSDTNYIEWLLNKSDLSTNTKDSILKYKKLA